MISKHALAHKLIAGCAVWLLMAAAAAAQAPAGQAEMRRALSHFANVAEKARPAVVTVEVLTYFPHAFNRNIIGEQAFLEQLDSWAQAHPEFLVTDEGFYSTRSGSGVILDARGHVLTSHHVVENIGARDRLRVTLLDGRRFEAPQVTVAGHDRLTDLSVLRLPSAPTPYPHLSWGNSTEARPGDWVMVLGNPLDFQFSVSEGIISGLNRQVGSRVQIERLIQTTAMINPGSSGGAMIDLDGRLIGIIMAMAARGNSWQGLGFAIPEEIARPVSRDLIAHGYVKRGFMGIVMEPITMFRARLEGLPAATGVRITRFHQGFPAERAGLRPNDIITAVDGRPVRSSSDVIREVGTRFAGDTVRLTVARQDGPQTFDIALAEAPDERELAQLLRQMGEALGPEPPPVPARARSQEGVPEPPSATSDIDILRHYGFAVLPRPTPQGGALVVSVEPSGRAERAGLRVGDIVVGVEGLPFAGITQFRQRLEQAEVTARLELRRGERLTTVTLRR